MSTVIPVDSNKVIADSYLEYGKYVNSFRAIPSVFDGLKPVYKRLVQTAYQAPNKFIKTADMLGQLMSLYHPHGTDSAKEVVSSLVKLGIFDGQGNFGYKHLDGDTQEAAAIRYTEVKMNSVVKDQLSKVAPYVPTHFSYSGNKEWDYVPTPIPYSLVTGTLGIAVGIGTRIPSFTMKSLLNAYLNDNPDLLEPNYGYRLTDKSGIRELWESGRGRITIEFPYDEVWEDQPGFLIYGQPEVFTLEMDQLNQWRSEGRIIIRDESDTIAKMFISRVKRIRTLTDEEIKAEIDRITKYSKTYNIRVAYNDVVKGIGIRDWIDLTYKNYTHLIELYKEDNLKKLDIQEVMWTNFKAIATRIVKGWDSQYVADELGIPVDIVNMVGRKQINTLQNANPNKELKAIANNKKYFDSIKPADMINEFVNEGFNGVNMEN